MRSRAILLSNSLKNVVDSGRLGNNIIVKTPRITAGMPYGFIEMRDVIILSGKEGKEDKEGLLAPQR